MNFSIEKFDWNEISYKYDVRKLELSNLWLIKLLSGDQRSKCGSNLISFASPALLFTTGDTCTARTFISNDSFPFLLLLKGRLFSHLKIDCCRYCCCCGCCRLGWVLTYRVLSWVFHFSFHFYILAIPVLFIAFNPLHTALMRTLNGSPDHIIAVFGCKVLTTVNNRWAKRHTMCRKMDGERESKHRKKELGIIWQIKQNAYGGSYSNIVAEVSVAAISPSSSSSCIK